MGDHVSTFKVSSDELTTLGQRVSAGSEETQTLLSNLGSQVAALAGVWDGQAAANFQNLYTEWQSGASQVREAMDGIARFLLTAAQSYETTEAQIAQAATNR